MANEWEPVPMAASDGWEPVPSTNDGWEPVSMAPQATGEFEGDEYAITPSIAEQNRMGVQGALALGDLIGSAPGAVAAGVAGLGTYAASGMDTDMALKAARETMNATTPSSMVRNLGEIMGNQNMVQGVDELRASKPYHELVERPFGALTMAARDIGGYITPGSYDDKERGADIAELMLFGAGAAGMRGKRGLTMQEQAYLDALRSIEQRKLADQRAAAQPPAPQRTPAEQLELDLGKPSPFRRPEPAFENSLTLGDMMDRAQERVTDATDTYLAETNGPQVDLFRPQAGLTEAGRENFRETFPGTRRTEELRKQEGAVPYEDARLAPELEQARIEQMQENTRITDMRADRPTIDFPLRQEAIDRDPYLTTLKEEADRAYAEYNRLQKWMDQFGKRPKSVIDRMDQAARHIEEVSGIAENYLKETYNVTKPDGYTGSMWADKPTALPIEKTPTYGVGKNREGITPLRLNKTKGGRQRGAIEFDFKHYKKMKEMKQFNKSLRERMDDHIQEMLQKISEYKGWPYKPGERLRSKKTGKAWRVVDYHWNTKKDIPQYIMETLDGEERGIMYADRMPDNFERFGIQNQLRGPGGKQVGGLNPEAFRGRKDSEFGSEPREIPNYKNWRLTLVKQDPTVTFKPVGQHREGAFNARGEQVGTYYHEGFGGNDTPRGIIEIDPFKGPGKKQAGGLNVDAFRGRNDPEFERFKADLPLPLRKNAKKLYKLHKEQQAELARQHATIYENENQTNALKNIPGLRNWRDEIAPIDKPIEDLIAQATSEPDLPAKSLGQQMVAGGKLYSFGHQNTVARYSVQQMDRALREASRQIEEHILNDNTGFKPKWEKLNKDEFAELWAVLRAHEGKMDLSREALFELGLSEKQVEAAMALRKSLDAIFDRFNQVRVGLGKKPIEKRLGYIPSRFLGDWVLEVRDAQGNLVHRLGASTKWGAARIKTLMEEKFPDLSYGEVRHEPIHRFKDASDATAGYQALLEVLTQGDERVAALESAYNDFLQQQAYEALNFRRHFKTKTGVGGAEGDKAWMDAHKNAEEGLRSVMNYMDHGLKWAESQEALKTVRQLLKDENVQATQPNAVRWAQGYIDQALGRSTAMARHIDAVADVLFEAAGIGPSLGLKTAREFKYFLTTWALGFWNLGFSISQLVQVAQTIPAWQTMFIKKGNLPAATMLNAYALGTMETLKAVNPNLEGSMSSFSKEAMQFAKTYGIIKPHILDDAKSIFGKQKAKAWEIIAEKSMTKPEEWARTMAYLTWAHFLKESGQFKAGRELFETAANLTDMTMVDYRGHERAMFYKNMGVAGEMANAITSYKHNYFSQLWALNKHAQRGGGLSPAMSMLTIGMLLSGLMGLPGREDVDAIIRLINAVSSKRIPTTRELFMKAPDAVSFGGLSALTGLDLSGKFSTANIFPDNIMAFLQPLLAMGIDLGSAVAALVANPSEAQLNRTLSQALPGGLKLLGEQAWTQKNARGQDIFIDPKTREGRARRGTKEKVARGLALRSLEESYQMNQARNLKDADTFNAKRRSALIGKAEDIVTFTKDPAELQRQLVPLAKKFVLDYEGNPKAFMSALENTLTSQQLTTLENMVMDAIRNPQKGKRTYDTVKDKVFK